MLTHIYTDQTLIIRWRKLCIALLFLDFIWFTLVVEADVYTSLVNIEPLLTTDKELSHLMNKYLEIEKNEISNQSVIMKLARKFLKPKFGNIKDSQEFLNHPINIFLLIKHLSVDWRNLKSKLNKKVINGLLSKHQKKKKRLQFPNQEDLIGAAVALSRLQEFYNLSVPIMANGEFIPGIKPFKNLSAVDCFEIGFQLYKYEEFKYSLGWLEEATNRHTREKKKKNLTKRLFELMAYNNFLIGKTHEALLFINQLLAHDPSNKPALDIKTIYNDAVNNPNNFTLMRKALEVSKAKNAKKRMRHPGMFDYLQSIYIKLCQNKQFLDPNLEPYLKCYYSTNNSPYLFLQPIKVEDVYHYPWIAIFHDIMSDNEIEAVKRLSTPKLKRADVFSVDGDMEVSDVRISQSSWLEDEYFPIVAKVSQRLKSVTGLEMNTAEDLQVVNYGIGGHYDCHIDFSIDDDTFKDENIGRRMATTLYYMTDVAAGGATVFPKLGIAVFPKKGSAVFWYNLHKSGTGDLQTIHGACPVLIGNKWVANKWIHERGQEFIRKCATDSRNYEDKEFD